MGAVTAFRNGQRDTYLFEQGENNTVKAHRVYSYADGTQQTQELKDVKLATKGNAQTFSFTDFDGRTVSYELHKGDPGALQEIREGNNVLGGGLSPLVDPKDAAQLAEKIKSGEIPATANLDTAKGAPRGRGQARVLGGDVFKDDKGNLFAHVAFQGGEQQIMRLDKNNKATYFNATDGAKLADGSNVIKTDAGPLGKGYYPEDREIGTVQLKHAEEGDGARVMRALQTAAPAHKPQ